MGEARSSIPRYTKRTTPQVTLLFFFFKLIRSPPNNKLIFCLFGHGVLEDKEVYRVKKWPEG
jgi:hypothetical protein